MLNSDEHFEINTFDSLIFFHDEEQIKKEIKIIIYIFIENISLK